MKTQWYVVYCKGRSEKKAAEILSRKKIENYLPLNKVVEKRNIEKVTDLPLFDSYLFVHTTEKQILAIKRIPPVINIVYWLGKPVVISDVEINTLKRFLDEHVNVKVEKITLGRNVVKKINTPSLEEENSFTIINQNIQIILPSLGYKVSAEETSKVRIISPDRAERKSVVKSFRFNPVQIFTNL